MPHNVIVEEGDMNKHEAVTRGAGNHDTIGFFEEGTKLCAVATNQGVIYFTLPESNGVEDWGNVSIVPVGSVGLMRKAVAKYKKPLWWDDASYKAYQSMD